MLATEAPDMKLQAEIAAILTRDKWPAHAVLRIANVIQIVVIVAKVAVAVLVLGFRVF